MAKSIKQQMRKIEKEVKKSTSRINKKLQRNPIILPVNSEIPDDGVEVQHIDNSIHIGGNVSNSQVGGEENIQLNLSNESIEKIFLDIKEMSKTMTEVDRNNLVSTLEELQNGGNVVSESGKSFLERHPLISMGISAAIQWGVTGGVDQLAGIIQKVFS